jgi:hypothetical protein
VLRLLSKNNQVDEERESVCVKEGRERTMQLDLDEMHTRAFKREMSKCNCFFFLLLEMEGIYIHFEHLILSFVSNENGSHQRHRRRGELSRGWACTALYVVLGH